MQTHPGHDGEAAPEDLKTVVRKGPAATGPTRWRTRTPVTGGAQSSGPSPGSSWYE
ncbi:hypothetical protein RKD18_002640 [Streptomyces phaeoluteigriseus]